MSESHTDGDDPAPELSIVVCTRDRHAFLAEAIASVERQTLASDRFELIVVDNSLDRVAPTVFLSGLSVRCRCAYAVEDCPGVSRARNIGLALARAPAVAFLDDDAVADPGWAAAALARFGADSAIGAVGGPVSPVWPDARPDWLPTWADGFLTTVDHGPDPRSLASYEWLAAASLAFRKSALDQVGGFDEGLGRRGSALLSNEDTDAVRRVREAGHGIFYEPGMRVRHRVHPERLSPDWLRRRMAWQAVSDVLERPAAVDAVRDRARLAQITAGWPDAAVLWDSAGDSAAVSDRVEAAALLVRLLLADPSHVS